MKQYYTYILASKSRVLYVGLTNDLERRLFEHTQKIIKGFTSKSNVSKLVWYEFYENIRDAIAREKQIKGWRREKKLALIESMNPQWRDLSAEWQTGRDSSTGSE